MHQRLNVICGNRAERMPLLMKELEAQGITDYETWPGVFVSSIKSSINLAHKQIVEYAKIAGWDKVVIAEDDIKFSHPDSFKYFLANIPKDYDLFLGGVFLGQPDENNVVKEFTGMTLYTVNARFYDTFLNVRADEHIDRALNGLGRYVVCNPFVVTQWDGWSSNTGKLESYEDLQKGRIFFGG